VIRADGAGPQPGRLAGEKGRRLLPVENVVERHGLGPAGYASCVSEKMARRDQALAMGSEVRPVLRDRRVQIELASIRQHQRDERGHRLRRREVVDDGVALPGSRACLVAEAAPDVDDGFAVDEHRCRCPDVGAAGQLGGEEITDPGETLVADPVDLHCSDIVVLDADRLHDVFSSPIPSYRATASFISNSLVTSTAFVRMLT
jgi:hypothetical protein